MKLRILLLATTLLVSSRTVWGQGTIVWNGPTVTYDQPSSDWTQPANQDRLTSDVWLTRGTLMGLFNAASESGYTHFFSPANTEWAYGSLSNYSTLTYQTWENWNGHNPPSMVGRPAVVHLISDNIYLSIDFTFWGQRGPGFSYDRSSPTVPEPSAAALALAGAGAWLLARRRKIATTPS